MVLSYVCLSAVEQIMSHQHKSSLLYHQATAISLWDGGTLAVLLTAARWLSSSSTMMISFLFLLNFSDL